MRIQKEFLIRLLRVVYYTTFVFCFRMIFYVPRLSVCSEQQNVGEDEVGPQDIRQAIVDYLF